MRRSRRVLFRALLALTALLAGLVAAELGLRLFRVDPPGVAHPIFVDEQGVQITRDSHQHLYRRLPSNPFLDYELEPGIRAYFQFDTSIPGPEYLDAQGRVPIHINAFGLRDVDFSATPAPDTHRILCLGDSFTFGFGVLLEDSYPKQLQRELRRRYPGRKFEVLNGGFAAGDRVEHHAGYLVFKGHALEPRTVILTICMNDIGGVPMSILRWTRANVPGQSWCHLAHLLSSALTAHRARRLSADPDACFERACGHGREVRYWRPALRVARDFCDARGIRLLVVVYPMLDGLDSDYPWIRIHEMIGRYGQEQGLELVDLLPVFRGLRDRDVWVHPTDQHPSPAGHARAVRAIADALAWHGWLP